MAAPLRRETLDWFAIKVAVREGRKMNLRGFERTIAIKLMFEKGYETDQIAEILGMSQRGVEHGKVRDWPVPRSSIPESVMGQPFYRRPAAWSFTLTEARKLARNG